MNIVILMGSPNKNGSTSILVDSFVQGAASAGHACEVVDVCRMNVHPCTGCVRCGYEGPCVQKDDVEAIRAKLLTSDMVVFATPLYYYGMSAQLKTVVEPFLRFQQQSDSQTSEIRLADGGMECGRLDVRCACGALQNPCPVYRF